MSNDTDTPQLEELEIVYMGRRVSRDKKTTMAFITRAQLETLGEHVLTSTIEYAASLFPHDPKGPGVIGGIYKMCGCLNEVARIIRLNFGLIKYVGKHESEHVPVFEANDTGARIEIAAAKREKNAKNSQVLNDLTYQLRQIYRNTSAPYRTALLVKIVKDISD